VGHNRKKGEATRDAEGDASDIASDRPGTFDGCEEESTNEKGGEKEDGTGKNQGKKREVADEITRDKRGAGKMTGEARGKE